VKLEKGKYEFYEDGNGILKCLRNGEQWKDYIGDKAVLCLFYRAQKLEESLSKVCAPEPDGFGSFVADEFMPREILDGRKVLAEG
jgi:hypothetical protein